MERSTRSRRPSPIAPNATTTLIVKGAAAHTLTSGTVHLYNLGISISSLNRLRNVTAAQLLRSGLQWVSKSWQYRNVGQRVGE